MIWFCDAPQLLYDSALQLEETSKWAQAADEWRACVNETLRKIEECRVQCVVAAQRLPEDRGVDSVDGVFEKAAGKQKCLCSSKMKQDR